MLLGVGRYHPWEIHQVGELKKLGGRGSFWICTCPHGQRRRKGYPCDHLTDMWDQAELGYYTDKLLWTPAGLEAGRNCRCRTGEVIPLQHPPPKPAAPSGPAPGMPSRNGPCPCGAKRGGVPNKFKKCAGTPDAPHEVGVYPLVFLTPPGLEPPGEPLAPPPMPPAPPAPPLPPSPPGIGAPPRLPDEEQKRLARVKRLILRAEAQHARDVWTDALLEKWRAWDELRRLRKKKVKDEAEIQALLARIEEWAERARTLRPPSAPMRRPKKKRKKVGK